MTLDLRVTPAKWRGAGLLLFGVLPAVGWACSSPAEPTGGGSGAGGGAGLGQQGGGAGMAAGGTAAGRGGNGSGGLPPTTGGSGGTTTGGSGGSGATSTTGGSAGLATGGTAGAPSAGSGSGGTGQTGSCTFGITSSLSEKIESVGIVEWTIDRATVDSASIEFGLDTSYGMSAPVDLAEAKYRTLLLGMKFDHAYHFRITAHVGTETCTSGDNTLMTGLLPNGLPTPTITTNTTPDKLIGGFTITEKWGQTSHGPAFILDADGDFVWVYPGEDDIIRTRMSFDGKAMWMRNTAQTDGTGVVKRVTLDGLHEDRWELPHTTHDLAVIPDGHLGLVAHAEDGCDEIMDFNPVDGSLTSLFNAKEAHGNSMCHVNYLAYFEGDQSFVFSDYEASSLIKITRAGEFVWGINGDASTISGTDWVHEHGVHILAPDHLLVFSNGDSQQNSLAIELKLDLTAKTATELWRYDASLETTFGGDIQRFANGNTLITYSSSGVIQEVDAQKNVLQQYKWGVGNTVAYVERRPTLYGGPPPKIYE